MAKAPEFELEEYEAQSLAVGLANVGRHYSAAVDPKTFDMAVLIILVLTIYTKRFRAISERIKAEKAKNVTGGRPDLSPAPDGAPAAGGVREGPVTQGPAHGPPVGPIRTENGMFVGLTDNRALGPPPRS